MSVMRQCQMPGMNNTENVLYLGGGKWRGHENPPHEIHAADMFNRSDIETARDFPSNGIK